MTNDPTDPGHDVEVLREHVRHLERRVRQLSTPTPETPAELAAKAKRIAMEARDWFARFEFEEARYREGNGHKGLRLEALNRTHAAIDELESLATLAASSTSPAQDREILADVMRQMLSELCEAREWHPKYRAKYLAVLAGIDTLAAAPAAAERKPICGDCATGGTCVYVQTDTGEACK